MAKFTGGTISVEDAVKHEGYPDSQFAPTRKVRVELVFAVGDDENGEMVATEVGNSAQHHVDRLLRKEVAGPAEASAPVQTSGAKKPGRKAKTEETPPATGKPAPIQVVLPPENKPAENPLDDFSDEGATTAVEITDKDLHDAMTRKAGELNGNPEPIKAIVKQFRPEGHNGKFGATDIPRTGPSRQKFLDAIKAIKA